MMRYRYRTFDWKLILAVILVVAIVVALMINRSAFVRLAGPKELTVVIDTNQSVTFNATITSQAGAAAYANYSWSADGRGIFEVKELSDNFDGRYSRFPLESGETRKLRFQLILVGEEPPEGRYFVDFHLESIVNGKIKRISNVYRLWVELESE
jgi:hypothetical protein